MHRYSRILMWLLAMLIAGPALAAGEAGMRRAELAAQAQVKGDLEQAIALYSEALADPTLAADRRAAILSDRGVVYARLNQSRLAIDDFNKAVQLYPEAPAAYNNRGSTLLALGLAKEAIKDFDRAIVLAPGYAAAYNNRAAATQQLKQHAEALNDYSRAIELMPGNPAPLTGRGRSLLSLGRPQAAIRDFTRAVTADARFTSAYRARAEAKLEIERAGEAVEDLSRAIAFEQNNAEVYVLRGNAYLAARNPGAALKDFSTAIEIAPTYVPALEARGLAFALIELFEDAEADFAKALEIDARASAVHAYHGYLLAKTGQADAGAREIEKAVKLDVDRAEVQWAKGEVEEALGKTNLAIESYRRAVAAKPYLRAAIEGLERLGITDKAESAEIPGIGTGSWRVIKRGRQMFAISDEYPRISVPVELAGEGQPKLLEWELKTGPYRGIGLLRFEAGQVAGPSGPEVIENVAVLDLSANALIAIVTERQGSRTARWTWGEEGKLTVASADGATDELQLRAAPREVAVESPARRQSDNPKSYGSPSWVPFGQNPSSSQGQPRREARRKPKTLFDMIFGN